MSLKGIDELNADRNLSYFTFGTGIKHEMKFKNNFNLRKNFEIVLKEIGLDTLH